MQRRVAKLVAYQRRHCVLPSSIRDTASSMLSGVQRQRTSEAQLNARIKKTLEVATSLWDLLDDTRRADLLAVVSKYVVVPA
jgi:hypothetical protein